MVHRKPLVLMGFWPSTARSQEDGAHTGPGNATFDANLRAENPEWGIRDISDIAQAGAELGFGPPSIRPMPANNRLLILPRQTRTARV